MADRGLFVLLCIAMLLPACADSQIHLAYRFEDGAVHRYRFEIGAERTLTGSGRTDVARTDLTLTASERVISSDAEGAELQLTLAGKETVSGRTFDLTPRTVRMTVAADGEAGLTGSSGSQDISQTLVGIRPPLAKERVGIGSTWTANHSVDTPDVQMQLTGVGELKGFRLEDGRRLAEVQVVLAGPVTMNQAVGRSTAKLAGEIEVSTTALLDIASGQLYSSRTTSTADFKVSSDSGVGRVTATIEASVRLL